MRHDGVLSLYNMFVGWPQKLRLPSADGCHAMACWWSKDTGWPGHRLVSLLLYLRAPAAGGETCLLQLGEGRPQWPDSNPGITNKNKNPWLCHTEKMRTPHKDNQSSNLPISMITMDNFADIPHHQRKATWRGNKNYFSAPRPDSWNFTWRISPGAPFWKVCNLAVLPGMSPEIDQRQMFFFSQSFELGRCENMKLAFHLSRSRISGIFFRSYFRNHAWTMINGRPAEIVLSALESGRYRKHCAHLFEAVSCQRPWCAGVTIRKTFTWKFQHITVLMYSPGCLQRGFCMDFASSSFKQSRCTVHDLHQEVDSYW